MVILGLLLGLVGTDVNSGVARFTFGMSELSDGIGFVIVAMGMFGFAEIIANLEQKEHREVFVAKVTGLMPTRAGHQGLHSAPILRGTALGSALGILPGGGALLASFARLHAGEEGLQEHGQVRQGRDPGRRGAGVGQQRRRADLVHSAAHARAFRPTR